MTEEITQQTTQEIANANQVSRSQERINQLSEKVELTAKERDELKQLREKDQQEIAELKRENAFSSGFSDMLGNYPAAKDHKDDIKTKVMSGYSVEDATLAVLGKAGKLGTVVPQQLAPQPAGGSAINNVQSAPKSPTEMNQAERREFLSKELMWS